jgi:hypothetical protein
MMLDAVRAEAPLEKFHNAAVLKLSGLHLEQVVGEREQPEPRLAQLTEPPGPQGTAASSRTSLSVPACHYP